MFFVCFVDRRGRAKETAASHQTAPGTALLFGASDGRMRLGPRLAWEVVVLRAYSETSVARDFHEMVSKPVSPLV